MVRKLSVSLRGAMCAAIVGTLTLGAFPSVAGAEETPVDGNVMGVAVPKVTPTTTTTTSGTDTVTTQTWTSADGGSKVTVTTVTDKDGFKKSRKLHRVDTDCHHKVSTDFAVDDSFNALGGFDRTETVDDFYSTGVKAGHLVYHESFDAAGTQISGTATKVAYDENGTQVGTDSHTWDPSRKSYVIDGKISFERGVLNPSVCSANATPFIAAGAAVLGGVIYLITRKSDDSSTQDRVTTPATVVRRAPHWAVRIPIRI